MKTENRSLDIMKITTTLLATLIALLTLSCETTPKAPVEGWTLLRGQTFLLWMPSGFEVQRPPTSESNLFCIFEPLPDGSKPPTLTIYEGFEPASFFSGVKEKQAKLGLVRERSGKVSVGQFQGIEAAGHDANGNLWRELQLRQPDQIAALHIWYFEAPKEKAAQFDAVIRSLQIYIRK